VGVLPPGGHRGVQREAEGEPSATPISAHQVKKSVEFNRLASWLREKESVFAI
jgi:hypothetical protein